MNEETQTLNSVISKAVNSTSEFNIENFKKAKKLSVAPVAYKEQKWIKLSKAFQDVVSVPGVAMGHINLFRGHSDTGKTTALLETAVECQKMGILPVLIVTEMKWSWEHARLMGFQFEEVPNAEGEVSDYKGFFLYIDREKLNTIEDVAAFIADILDEQKKGNLPFDLCFLWDSIGSIPCRMSVESNKNNNEWNAGAMATQFGNFINQKFPLSRKVSQPYTNTLVAINKVWVLKPGTPMEKPKLKNKNGDTMFFDATLVFTFGNVANSGTNKIKATKGGKTVQFAKITKISCDKNHITGVETEGRIVMTPHGFINNDKKAIDKYKKDHSKEWLKVFGTTDFDLVEEESTEAPDYYETVETD